MPTSSSAGIEVRPHPTRGRGLFATRAFAPSEPIHVFQPILLVPTTRHLADVCTYCLRHGEPRACTRCRSASYCGAACQAADWAFAHKRECKALAALVGDGGVDRRVPTPVRALAQLLRRRDASRAVAGLEGHVSRRRDAGEVMEMARFGSMLAHHETPGEVGDGEVQRAFDLLCKVGCDAA